MEQYCQSAKRKELSIRNPYPVKIFPEIKVK